MNEKRRMHYESILDEVAKQASQTERRAEEAERETVKLKKCEYMENHIGEEFEGSYLRRHRMGILWNLRIQSKVW